eukprot:TRINITY_DN2635_c0_g1_i1.p1 TRINITY_DN2635_c0_g1~~TRINITY_DN2635_c0_g1_i1.p1  ORF type:complete len:807 (+),score=215.19 TRINITY_DN2635_c0_g1_i1:58-2421(+)
MPPASSGVRVLLELCEGYGIRALAVASGYPDLSVAEPMPQVLDVVEVRNGPRDTWKRGMVMSVDPIIEVRVTGWEFACEWAQVRRPPPLPPPPPPPPVPSVPAPPLEAASSATVADTEHPGLEDVGAGGGPAELHVSGTSSGVRRSTASLPELQGDATATLRHARGCYARSDIAGCADALASAAMQLGIELNLPDRKYSAAASDSDPPRRVGSGTLNTPRRRNSGSEASRGVQRRRLRAEEELRWLAGMIAKKRGDFVGATRCFDDAIALSRSLHACGQQRPTTYCLEALRARGVALLHRGEYGGAVQDYKEWLLLRDRYADRRDCTSVLYNLALCYKHMDLLIAAEATFERARSASQQAGGPGHQVVRRAEDSIRVCRLIRAVDSEDSLLQEMQHIRLRGSDTAEAQASKLHMLRAMVHHYLAQQSVALIRMRMEAASKSLSRRLFGGGKKIDPQQALRGRVSPSEDEARSAILSIASAFFRHFFEGDSELVREYIHRGTCPQLQERLQQSPLGTTLKQALNFCAEFSLNHSSIAAWKTACLSEEQRVTLVKLEDFPSALPWRSQAEAPDPARQDTLSDGASSEHEGDGQSEYSAGEPEPRRHVPELLGIDPKHGELDPLISAPARASLARELPRRYQDLDWVLVYSSRIHGCSIVTFYRMTADAGPNLFVCQDMSGGVFGAFTLDSYSLRRPGWYGTGETFVWKVCEDKSEVEAWRWAYHNQFFVMSRSQGVTFGGGGSPALAIEGDLMDRGTSGVCQTFDSKPLSQQTDFNVCCVEVWALIDDD